VPDLATVKVKVEPPVVVKVAVTDRAWVIDTTHEPVPIHAPDHPAKVDPRATLAVKVTEAPEAYDWVQSPPQLIPAGELFTVPTPAPALVTVRMNGPPPEVVKVAVTDRA
jgi:hypothetical protein